MNSFYDGFRAVAFKSNGKIQLRFRNDKDFNVKYPAIMKALHPMSDETVIDGEIVAFDNPVAHVQCAEGRGTFLEFHRNSVLLRASR